MHWTYQVWNGTKEFLVDPARAKQRWVDEVRSRSGCDHEDPGAETLDAVELSQQLVNHAISHARAIVASPERKTDGRRRDRSQTK